jgi:acetoacetyl-CoA synthetase
VQGILDRFGQIEPRVLVVCDGYWYNGKSFDVTDKIAEVAAKLPSVEKIIVIDYLGHAQRTADSLPNAVTFDAFIAPFAPGDINYRRLPFDHPLYILFSSGTTGVPKCIVHRAGGVLLKHLSEHQLHCGINPGDRLFYFTTCGWMMWNWVVTGLATGATVVLYDGSPFYPGAESLFDMVDAEGINVFGVGAKYISGVEKAGLKPRESHSLVSTILSTGSPLSQESFRYVYRDVKTDVCLSSISGGTDIISCFVLGNECLPVYEGELQCAGLGMAVQIWDESGHAVREQKGELICAKPFPSAPLGFWNDPDGQRYHKAYFATYPGIWAHGDYAEITANGGMIIYGRSDAVLNPGGVRIGTAEIYRQVESLDEVIESICVGQAWDDDVRVVLFVVLRPGVELDDDLTAKIRTQIRQETTPRHVPAKIISVADIPRTRSGKIAEIAVRDVINGKTVANLAALSNPDALELYQDLDVLKA